MRAIREINRYSFISYLVATIWLIQSCQQSDDTGLIETEKGFQISTENYQLVIQNEGFCYQFQQPDGEIIAAAHPESGILIGNENNLEPLQDATLILDAEDHYVFGARTQAGNEVTVEIWSYPHAVKMKVHPEDEGEYAIMARTAGLSPAYGMGDHAAFGEGSWNLVLDDFVRDPWNGERYGDVGSGDYRMISNFVIFPQHGFAEVNIEPGYKVLKFTGEENLQGSREVREMPAMYYFVGNPKEIYQAFLETRNQEGYPVFKPKHEWFGVGWEAFGALAWNTNQETVTENVDRYLAEGYPLEWMVVGSGFWPSGVGEFDEHGTPYTSESESEAIKKLQATTSFGMWDQQKYPNPNGLINHFHNQGLIFTIGLRIGFIPGGPFTDEGLENGYFITGPEGEAELMDVGFPRQPVYLLDSENEQAVEWYVDLSHKWTEYGIDGFKEDLFGWPASLPDDLIDPVNRLMMEQGIYIMGRNNYLGSACDIHRFNDFNYNQNQDRGPINGLAYAFSGFPYVYPDIVGGTGLATGRFGEEQRDQLKVYLMRYAIYAAVNPSMSFGYGPWNFDTEANQVCLNAANLHDRLKPYIYSNAVKAYETGFPYSMIPLPLAYPQDENVYGLADTVRRSYQWLIGESMLATPLFGDDYYTANSRDVYLPEGKWIDYDTGEEYQGPTTLENFQLPVDKTPLFVGGEGIIVEKKDDKLMARIYPVKEQAELEFTDFDGDTRSQIEVANPNWDNLVVSDQESGNEIPVQKVQYAYEFEIIPGQNYLVK